MPTDPFAPQLLEAVRLQQAGQFAPAIAIYQRVLSQSPNHPDALNLTGVLLTQVGQYQQADAVLRQAVTLYPGQFTFRANHAQVLLNLRRYSEALAAADEAIRLSPSTVQLYLLKSNVLSQMGQKDEALSAIRAGLSVDAKSTLLRRQLAELLKQVGKYDQALPVAMQLQADLPNDPDLLVLVGQIQSALGSTKAAQACYSRALHLNPNHASAMGNLGLSVANEGLDLPRAKELLMQTIRIEPASPHEVALALADVLIQLNETELGMNLLRQVMDGNDIPKGTRIQAAQNLANVLFDSRQIKEAAGVLYEAAEIDTTDPLPWAHLAYHAQSLLPIDKALEYADKSLSVDPKYWYAKSVKAAILTLISRADEATALVEEAMANCKPNELEPLLGASLLSYHYVSDFDPERTLAAHRRWGALVTPSLPFPRHSNTPDPDRRLRVGFVSPDLREHVVATFMEPIFRHHNPETFEIFVYDSGVASGGSPERFKSFVTTWRDVAYLEPGPLAEMIRRDKIDVLVDLAGHTRDGRLMTFALKPAPVQITYLGYPNTTGLDRIDYRITDEIADPPGQTERWHTEQLLRLDRCAWCWLPGDAIPPEPPLAADGNGYITFGSFNNTAKINDGILDLWGQILAQVPTAKLLIKGRAMQIDFARHRIIQRLCRGGAREDQIMGTKFEMNYSGHFEQIARVDIALDTFPYTGTTTTVEMLYLGLPVVTLQGAAHVSRVSSSLLTAVGLTELIATTKQDYVGRAVALANDIERVRHYRRSLRNQLMASPVADGKDMARAFSNAIRAAWKKWCVENGK